MTAWRTLPQALADAARGEAGYLFVDGREGRRRPYAEIHRGLDRFVLPGVLEHTGGNQARAAVLLGIARRTLRTKLGELDLQVTRTVGAGEAEPP